MNLVVSIDCETEPYNTGNVSCEMQKKALAGKLSSITSKLLSYSLLVICFFFFNSFIGLLNYNYCFINNRVRGPYCKLRTEFFPVDLWPKREARGP